MGCDLSALRLRRVASETRRETRVADARDWTDNNLGAKLVSNVAKTLLPKVAADKSAPRFRFVRYALKKNERQLVRSEIARG